jgi:uncharacterized protein (DUF1015 family)
VVTLAGITGCHVTDAHAPAVVAPPYDTLSPAERETRAAEDPATFLHVLPPRTVVDGDLEALFTANRAALDRLLAEGRFSPLPDLCLVVLTLTAGSDTITYVVGNAAAAAYTDGRILPHERVQADRVEQLAHYLDVVGAVSSPVCVIHRPDRAVTEALVPVLAARPEVAFDAGDGLELALRVVDEPARMAALTAAIDAAGTLYLADGHHRAAAIAAHVARHHLPPDHPEAQVLTAVVAADQLTVLPFHRRVATDGRGGTAHLDVEVAHWLAARDLHVVPLDRPTVPDRPGTFTLAQHGRWWLVDARRRRRPGAVEGLDVRLVEREVLGPLLGTDDPAHDPRVEAIAHPVGLEALDQPGTFGLALHPPGTEALLAVAEAGESMPPKTTYVTPKLRSGLLIVPWSVDDELGSGRGT